MEDDQGAEVDIDTFPILLELSGIPNLVFKLAGEEYSEFTVNLTDGSPPRSDLQIVNSKETNLFLHFTLYSN